jgi:nascent polypeptide-associated complex subunit alpha
LPTNLGDRKTRRMMDRMGINMKEMPDVEEVIIKTASKELHIRAAQVSEINAQGNRIFQVMGDVEEVEKAKKSFSDEDILLVQQQANVTKEKAIIALEESDGEVAKAILRLMS